MIVRFIAYDAGTINAWTMDDVVPSRELMGRIDERMPLVPVGSHHPVEVGDR